MRWRPGASLSPGLSVQRWTCTTLLICEKKNRAILRAFDDVGQARVAYSLDIWSDPLKNCTLFSFSEWQSPFGEWQSPFAPLR
jgi:hypothetical protein